MTYPVLIYKILYYFRFINKDGSNNNFQHIILRLRSYCLCSETSNCQNLTQKEETVELSMHLSSETNEIQLCLLLETLRFLENCIYLSKIWKS